jgi:hypothetical protein
LRNSDNSGTPRRGLAAIRCATTGCDAAALSPVASIFRKMRPMAPSANLRFYLGGDLGQGFHPVLNRIAMARPMLSCSADGFPRDAQSSARGGAWEAGHD